MAEDTDSVSDSDIRAQAIETGAMALYGLLGYTGKKPHWHSGDAEHLQAATVFDATAQIIRADEQANEVMLSVKQIKAQTEVKVRERLQAQVRALRDNNRTADWDYHRALDDVLAMVSDEPDGTCPYCGGVGCRSRREACDARFLGGEQ